MDRLLTAQEERKKPPKPTCIPKQIEALTRLMDIRRDEAEPPYVLVLGAGTSLSSGCSSGARVIEDVVSQLSRKDVAALSWEEKIAEFYNLLDNLSPTERYTILKRHVVGQAPSPGYRHLAQLIKAGYFDLIFSTNFDVFLEDALSDAGLRARDFIVLINNRASEEEIVRVLGFSEPRVKLVKLHGDLPARIFAFTPEEIFQFSDKIERVLKEYLCRDIIIVGHSMRDDDLNRCIRAQGGSIWYANPSPPTVSDFVGRAIKVRGGRIISGEMGKFDDFFQALGEALLGEAQRQAELSALYSKGMEALATRDWPTAIEQFKALLALNASYKDAIAMLAEAQRRLEQEKEEERRRLEAQERERARQEQLRSLYAEGTRAVKAQDWEAAIVAFRQVVALDSIYRDATARLATAEAEQKKAEEEKQREAQPANLYAKALQHFNAQRWREAVNGFKAVLEIDRGYRDAAVLLAEAKHQKELASLPKPPAARPAPPRRRKPTTLPR